MGIGLLQAKQSFIITVFTGKSDILDKNRQKQSH